MQLYSWVKQGAEPTNQRAEPNMKTVTTNPSKSINISHTVSPDSVGDWGCLSQEVVANSLAKFIENKWGEKTSSMPELEGFDIEINIDANPSFGEVYISVDSGYWEIDLEIEALLKEELNPSRLFEEFCFYNRLFANSMEEA